MSERRPIYLSIIRCPQHGFFAVAIEDQIGNGRRLTPSKCCGSWETVKRWPIDDRKELISQIEGFRP